MKLIGAPLVGFLLLIVAVYGVYSVGYRSADRVCQSAWSERDASEAKAAISNFIWTMDIFRQAQEAISNDKDAITLDTQRAAADVKNYTEGADCADRVVPDVYDQRVRNYADSLRDRAAYPDP